MPARAPRRPRRATHSREQIVETAIAVLDREGAAGLTLRGLAAELGGGLGSVYWYVEGKRELMELCCDVLFGRAVDLGVGDAEFSSPPMDVDLDGLPEAVQHGAVGVRRLAMALFGELMAHPWLAAQSQLVGAGRVEGMRFWDALGRQLAVMGLSPQQQFIGSTAVIGYVMGVSAEMMSQDAHADPGTSKEEQLRTFADSWQGPEYEGLDWLRSIGEEFAAHDDTEQFAGGLDLLVTGLVHRAV
ncbi:TetR/AcrR family transcriptional regulator [Nocardioides acrostichi]|uniref:TetR/AcrR family transcriptional regulator n=1 Tax=Nocardioides acrostichi TaxID=2784339 RepID=A0A930V070_9ACTN|nr:TetR/AcrR family transcriptional regulator C-terminal domain-containing protein [Nocardioides acrostichi]MBF4161461.1 TetR/AcrR family transcriptional regulator [Nocardioides acrostichi]